MNTKWIIENFTHESSYMDLVKAIKKENGNYGDKTLPIHLLLYRYLYL
jgi:hypothetical protein